MDENPHILVVDDDRRLRELLQKFLSDSGFRVTTAESAMDAREKLASIQFDLLVLDLMMPDESGLELTSGLRKTNPVPILMLTAMAEQDDKIEGLERGADEHAGSEPQVGVVDLELDFKSLYVCPNEAHFAVNTLKYISHTAI